MKADSFTPQTPSNFQRLPKVCARTGIGPSRIYELVAEGKFPRPLKITPNGRASAWLEKEVDSWMLERIAERDAAKKSA